MADLPKEFFRRDLTTAEWETLEGQLSASPKVSMRFAKLAKKFYLGLGLPNPEGPSELSNGALSVIVKIMVLLSVIAIFMFWKVTHPPPEIKPVPKMAPAVTVQHTPIPTSTPKPKALPPKPKATPTPLPPPPTAVPTAPPTATPTAVPATPTATEEDAPKSLFGGNGGYRGFKTEN